MQSSFEKSCPHHGFRPPPPSLTMQGHPYIYLKSLFQSASQPFFNVLTNPFHPSIDPVTCYAICKLTSWTWNLIPFFPALKSCFSQLWFSYTLWFYYFRNSEQPGLSWPKLSHVEAPYVKRERMKSCRPRKIVWFMCNMHTFVQIKYIYVMHRFTLYSSVPLCNKFF